MTGSGSPSWRSSGEDSQALTGFVRPSKESQRSGRRVCRSATSPFRTYLRAEWRPRNRVDVVSSRRRGPDLWPPSGSTDENSYFRGRKGEPPGLYRCPFCSKHTAVFCSVHLLYCSGLSFSHLLRMEEQCRNWTSKSKHCIL